MGDDLGDEWWLDDAKKSSDTSSDEDENRVKGTAKGRITQSDKTEFSKVSPTKRKAEEDVLSQKKTKRKRRTKQKISEHLSKSAPMPATVGDVMAKMEQHFKEKLSPIELDDLQLNESHFLSPNLSSQPLSTYLESAILNWRRDIEAKRPKAAKTCLLLLLTASARRAVDLNREAAAFKGKQCVSAKLFSKHMKIQDQADFLAKNRVQFAVGTPNRIAALLQQDVLNLAGTRYLVLDWNWRDVKFKRMCDIPELKTDLFGLFEKYVIPQAKTGDRLKIGIF
ncbi:protein CMSS1-like [Acanthaster planci]|uniref:Protein CMSS1-like n=1 Tax=Acanthaster planci TaxID=133434 RepID=A0A8B7Y9H6_ACAPL|nr:protein CMSS1-like [Acanthaster planci]